ncbi:EIN3-binding F-box protein 1 [Prunus yedoensis var. nudiflora]|uniref:EIN3-binding F-box protein 1 n=1 Tax=Prunus yedoensis var. nudiflora TaxID=2094558 RepID=A0A314U721_PRUYE|nr:EIN3-binding F-box protein 1 [Prunus yedoensis var. nudiflora]
MSKLLGFAGNDDFCPGGSIYTNPKEPSLFLSRGIHADAFFNPRKRSRISGTFVFSEEGFEHKKPVSIDVLPDECLFEIFKRLPGGEERSACACVSKRWLTLLSNIHRDEFCSNTTNLSLNPQDEVTGNKDPEVESCGYLSRSLEGKKATDVRLAAIAVGTASRGGLGKLTIRGSNSGRGVTNLGLRAISHGCPSLRVLSLWNVSSIGDEGLCEIANRCHMLEKFDLAQCPAISDKGLVAIAKKCPNLTDLSLESCSNIGNEGLQAIGQCCPNLKSISIKNCPLVGDQGIASLLSSVSYVLTKVKLQALTITDVSLAVIGHYGKAITDLVLTSIPNVTERGFWVMGNGHGLQKLKSFTVTSCQGVTDTGLEAVGKGCPNLKQFCLRKCLFISDSGLVSFCKAAGSLESLHLRSATGLPNMDLNLGLPEVSPCQSLRSLSIRNCPGFGNAGLALLGRLCPQLQHVDFSGLEGITDAGFLPLLENCEAGLVKVNLSGCVNVTDKVVSSMAKLHGWSLEMVNLEGCKMISDAGLVAIAGNCPLLSDLDVSRCAITDFGIASLACADQLNLQILAMSGCPLVSDKSLPALVKMGQTFWA